MSMNHDVHNISEVSLDSNWNGDYAIYSHHNEGLVVLQYNVALPVSLKVLEHENFTVAPMKVLAPGFSFVPLGLIGMYNGGGAIESVKYEVKSGAKLSELENGYEGERCIADSKIGNLSSETVAIVSMEVKGCGRFGAYSSAKPRKCTLESNIYDFVYNNETGLVTFNLNDMPAENKKVHIIEIEL